MRIRKVFVKDIIGYLGDSVLSVDGSPGEEFIDNLADVQNVSSTTLDWIKPSSSSQHLAESSKANVLLVGQEVLYSSTLLEKRKILIHVRNPKLAIALIGNAFFVDNPRPGIHPTAIVDPSAIIGDRVSIGAYSVIGKATIGSDCQIDTNVRIYDDVFIGIACHIKSGSVIGGEGFGFERDEEGNKFRFPQIGRVVIGDCVEIGANTCVDRGALSDTIIGNHTKINNLCHIAHNNKIGRNVTIAGCVNVSGSNTIQDNVWIAPHACIRGFLDLGEKCVIGMGAIVTKNVPAGETWIGNPAHKMEKK